MKSRLGRKAGRGLPSTDRHGGQRHHAGGSGARRLAVLWIVAATRHPTIWWLSSYRNADRARPAPITPPRQLFRSQACRRSESRSLRRGGSRARPAASKSCGRTISRGGVVGDTPRHGGAARLAGLVIDSRVVAVLRQWSADRMGAAVSRVSGDPQIAAARGDPRRGFSLRSMQPGAATPVARRHGC